MDDRSFWLDCVERICRKPLEALAKGELKSSMPVEAQAGLQKDRARFTHLEALGRTACGIAPWLETQEDSRCVGMGDIARAAIAQAVDPQSADYLDFRTPSQPIVDAAFLAHAIVRAPKTLGDKLDEKVRARLIDEFKASRTLKPHFNNWLLFSAMIEAGLDKLGEAPDPMRIDYALRQHEQWYKGDGVYGDGPEFHWDYYNSFVIQPMLLDLAEVYGAHLGSIEVEKVRKRAVRFAAVQERMISADGTFPPLGRSLAYRFGAFQHLAQMALRDELGNLVPAQVRCALTSVIRRGIEAAGTFDAEGWLQVGFYGHQPDIGENYISTGSLYLCSAVFLPLGLSADHPFWSGPDASWTQKKIWAGEDCVPDSALKFC